MAIAQMAKVIIATHRSQASELLEALQHAGICQILNAEEAAVTKELDDIDAAPRRPKDIELLLSRLEKSIAFVKTCAAAPKGLAAALAPRTIIDESAYQRTVSDRRILEVVHRCEAVETSIEKTKAEIEKLQAAIEMLAPWKSLDTPVEEMGQLNCATCRTGLIPIQHFAEALERIGDLGGALETAGSAGSKYACLVVGLNEVADDLAKALRAAEFEPVSFEGMTGKVAVLIAEQRARLALAQKRLAEQDAKTAALAENLLNLQILYDHYRNILNREQTQDAAPATEHAVLLEGWVKKKDYARLKRIVSRFGASSLSTIEPAEDEKPPVEIDNKNFIKPFEVVTRLYGMPQHFEVDPTAFLAPFFGIFFALCLTDAGYGLVMIALIALFIKKMQGDTKLMWMLGICSVITVVAGALTGGWFGNAHEYLPSQFTVLRNGVMWFDPLEKPMHFFYLSLALGYFQIMVGLAIAFAHNLKQKDYVAAVIDQLTWIVMLNSIVAYAAMQGGSYPNIAGLLGKLALLPAAMILIFSHREGGWAGRLGMGAYNLFSAIFYMGDVLSYLRLMALGMVTAGLAMAVNVIATIAADIPYGIGFVVMVAVLVGGHGFNLVLSGLSAFVHTLRLQYVEFFPKFLAGGGRSFQPLSKQYKHIYIGKVEH